MKNETNKKRSFLPAFLLLALFAVYTLLVMKIDVAPIGPNGSSVGFSGINGWAHEFFGVNWALYTITDWLGLLPLAIVGCFALLGLYQLVSRRSLAKVDKSILVLGGFYVLVFAAYIFFEKFEVNYRPELVEGILETSYPSSTTMLALCVMSTFVMQLRSRLKSAKLSGVLSVACGLFALFMVIARLFSGVHWLSDIIGGIILSIALVTFYRAGISRFAQEE